MITLKGITWEHERGYGSVVAAAREYALVRPDVRVEWEFRSLQSFADQHLEDLVREYDLLVIDHPHIPQAAEEGLLARLDGRGHDDEIVMLAAQSVGDSHRSYEHAGGLWGLASDAAAQVSAFRPDLIEKPPADWDEVLELAAEGRVLWPYKPVDAWSSLITVIGGLGEVPMASGETFAGRDVLTRAMSILRVLAERVPDSNAQWNPIETADALSAGSQYAYCPLLFGYSNYGRAGFRAHRLAYRDIPRTENGVAGSLLGGAGIAVSAFSGEQDAAVDHAFWLASADVQRGSYYQGGGQPGNAVAWEDAAVNADSLDFFAGTRRTLEGAYLRPRHPRYIDLQNEASVIVHRALLGEIDDATLGVELDAAVTKWIGR